MPIEHRPARREPDADGDRHQQRRRGDHRGGADDHVEPALEHAVPAVERRLAQVDDRQRLELLDAAAQRGEPEDVRHVVDGDRIVADAVEDRADARVVGVGQRDDHDVDLVRVEHRADVLGCAEPARLPLFALVAQTAQHSHADVRPPAQDAKHLGRRLAAAHHDRVAEIVAATARHAEGLAKDHARHRRADDRGQPEDTDGGTRVVVAAEQEAHHRDQHDDAQTGGLRDVPPLAQVRAQSQRTVEVERLERKAPDDEDRQQLERVVAEGRDIPPPEQPRPGCRVEAQPVREEPARRDHGDVDRQRDLLEQPRVGLQHARRARNSRKRPSR